MVVRYLLWDYGSSLSCCLAHAYFSTATSMASAARIYISGGNNGSWKTAVPGINQVLKCRMVAVPEKVERAFVDLRTNDISRKDARRITTEEIVNFTSLGSRGRDGGNLAAAGTTMTDTRGT